jgi:hypothetical protein
MSTKPLRGAREAEALLQDLMATPEGRRWLLKAGRQPAPTANRTLGQTEEIKTLGTSIATMKSQGKDFAKALPATNSGGGAIDQPFRSEYSRLTGDIA